MMLFDDYCAIPLSQVVKIVFFSKTISIHYFNGEYVDLEFGDGRFPRVEIKDLKFDSEDDVVRLKRQFYKACSEGKKAFYFG